MNIAASGSSIIDVGGKDELAVFYRLCKKLSIDCRIIADYDALFRGKLRECFCADDDVKARFVEKGQGIDPSKCIGDLESSLLSIGDDLSKVTVIDADSELECLLSHLASLYIDRGKNLDTIRDAIYLSVLRFSEKIKNLIPARFADIDLVENRIYSFIDSIKSSNIFIIEGGELEHFFKASSIVFLKITNKDKLFQSERDHILGLSGTEVSVQYEELLSILKESVPFVNVDLLKHLRFTMIDFIHRVQTAVERGDVSSIETLRTNGSIDFATYSQILDCDNSDFAVDADRHFSCRVIIKKSLLGEEKAFEFSDKTTARDFHLS